jgi:mRNA-degrading endonuclease RelE of RelBE toxin-antitoxin system
LENKNHITYTPRFAKDVKPIIKKFRTFGDTLERLEETLLKNPRMGDAYGKNIYKIRVADESKGKGKSGGFRVITYVIDETAESTHIYMITIFDKSEDSTIKKTDAVQLIRKCGL